MGTAEEFFYILGILLLPANKDICLPLVLTGPKESEAYFKTLDRFVERTLGKEAQKLYEIIIDDPASVAKKMKTAMPHVKECRQQRGIHTAIIGFSQSHQISNNHSCLITNQWQRLIFT